MKSLLRAPYTWLVLIPTLICGVYYAFLASDIYVSEAKFTVRAVGGSGSSPIMAGLLGDIGASPSTQDISIVSDFIQSPDMLELLEKDLSLREHYSQPGVDAWARLDSNVSDEDFTDYYLDMIEVHQDEKTGIVWIRAKAFSAEMAERIAQSQLDYSEILVNKMSEKMMADGILFARDNEKNAYERAVEATNKLTAYRNTTNTVDPNRKSGAVLGIITSLESSLADARTTLGEMREYLRDDSPEVAAMESRVKALSEQISEENLRLTGSENAQLISIMDRYEQLVAEKEMAQQLYASALTSLEAARLDATRQKLYLITFIKPSKPGSAVEPEKFWDTLTVWIVLTLIYIVGGLLLTTVRDHVGVAK